MPDYHRDPRVNVRAPADTQEAAQQQLGHRGWTMQTYIAACIAAAAAEPDQALTVPARHWREAKRPGRPRKDADGSPVGERTAAVWTGDNFAEIQALRPDARLTPDGTLEVEHVDQPGQYVIVGLNYVIHRRADDT